MVPYLAFASWWNPFSWGWADFFSGLLSFDASDKKEQIIETDGLCPGVPNEATYIDASWELMKENYLNATGGDLDSLDKNLSNIEVFEKSVIDQKKELTYFDQGKWQQVIGNYLSIADLLKESNRLDKLVRSDYDSPNAEIYEKRMLDVEDQISDLWLEANKLYSDIDLSYMKVYNDCADKVLIRK